MLQRVLAGCTNGVPFLLQPLVDTPSLLQARAPADTCSHAAAAEQVLASVLLLESLKSKPEIALFCACKQGDPGPRLLRVAGLLRDAAACSGDAAVAAMAAAATHSLMFTSVCRGFVSTQGHSPRPAAPPGDASALRTTEVLPPSSPRRVALLQSISSEAQMLACMDIKAILSNCLLVLIPLKLEWCRWSSAGT